MMKSRFFQEITFAAADPKQAQSDLAVLLNCGPSELHLGNTQLKVEQGGAETETTISGLVLHCEALNETADRRGLSLSAAQFPAEPVAAIDADKAGIQAVDHVVLKTNNADDCVRLFRDHLGMRLALDQMVEEWGGRMLFFREGSMTLEVIENSKDLPDQDWFWGISYRCADLQATHSMLSECGVALSEIREGRKPGTRVATIKSHCAGVASLLVGT